MAHSLELALANYNLTSVNSQPMNQKMPAPVSTRTIVLPSFFVSVTVSMKISYRSDTEKYQALPRKQVLVGEGEGKTEKQKKAGRKKILK